MTLVRAVSGAGAGVGRGRSGCAVEEIRGDMAEADRAALDRFVLACGDRDGMRPRGTHAALATRPGRDVRCWVARAAEGDGEILGVMAVTATGHGPAVRHSISWLLVRPQARRRGIGMALVAAAIDQTRAAGGGMVWVETKADWDAAAFWDAAGFRRAGSDAGPLV